MHSTNTSTSDFLVTKEYRRFEEFCNACRRDRYIGICYGPPGVGKTLSARYYAQWDLLQVRYPFEPQTQVPQELADCRTLFYTPGVMNSPRQIREHVDKAKFLLDGFVYHARCASDPYPDYCDFCELIIVDEADRLKMPSLEQLRDLYDRGRFGLILIGMPGLEKRLARYPQLYSRVGFAHAYRPLSKEEMHFVLEHHFQKLGLSLRLDDFTDQEAVATVIRVTAGNFRLLQHTMPFNCQVYNNMLRREFIGWKTRNIILWGHEMNDKGHEHETVDRWITYLERQGDHFKVGAKFVMHRITKPQY